MDLTGHSKPKIRTWWFPVRNNIEGLSQAHVFLKVLGLLPYTVADRVNGTIIVSVSDLMVMAFFTVFRVFGIASGLSTGVWKAIFESETVVIMYGIGFTMFFSMILSTLTPFLVLYHKRRVEAMLRHLEEFDDELGRLGYPRDHQYYHFTITVFLTVCLVALGIIMTISLLLRDISSQMVVFLGNFNVATFGYTLFHTVLNVVILGVHSRMQLLIRCTAELMEGDGWLYQELQRLRRQRKDELVIQLAKLYDKLCDVTDGVNAVFCSPLIFQFVNVFFVHLTSAYAGLRVLLNRATPRETVHTVLYLCWSVYFNFFVFQTIIYVAALRYQKSKFVSVVHRCINLPHNEAIIQRLHQLSEQITSRTPQITFFFFDLHPSIIVQACAELATYLLILVQFDLQ